MKLYLAGGVIQDTEGRVLLVHRQTDQIDHWEVPGGKQENGETLEQTVAREIQEELGISISDPTPIGIGTFAHGESEVVYHYYFVRTEGVPAVQETQTFSELAYVDLSSASTAGYKLSSGAKELARLLADL